MHTVGAADWPQWGGTQHRNMVSSEHGLPTKFAPGRKRRDRHGGIGFDLSTAKNVKWLVRLGSRTYSSPVVANGRVFIGTNDATLEDPRFKRTEGGVLKCLREDDGSLIWQLVVPRLEIDRSRVSEDFDALNLGICSTPTVDGDRVYVVTNRCEVLCLDVAGLANGNDGLFQDEGVFSSGGTAVKLTPLDADIIWRFDMLREIPNFPHDASNCCVLVHGDYVYAGTSNGVSYERVLVPEAPSLIALDKHTGELAARDDTYITPNVLHGQWSSPSCGSVGDKELVFYGGGDGRCYAFEALTTTPPPPQLLKEVWSFDANPARYRLACPTTSDYWEIAIRGRKGRTDEGVVGTSEIIGTPVLYKGRVYVTIGQDPMHGPGSGALSCFDATKTGDITKTGRIWQYTDIGRSMATVSIEHGLLYAADSSGKVHCLDARTGSLHWVLDIGESTWGSTLVADGNIYLGTRRGVTVLKAGLAAQHVCDIKLSTRVPSAPIAANGVLYVTSQKYLWAIEEKGEMP